jgi:flagellar biogenesis protein FliO
MQLLLRLVALGVVSCLLQVPATAQTPGPPEWQDGAPSVYSAGAHKEVAAPTVAALREPPVVARKLETGVVPSAHEVASPIDEPPGRRLALPSMPIRPAGETTAGHSDSGARRLMDFGIPTQSIYTIVTALTIVIGSFLLFAWVLRRGGRRGANGRGMLPAEAVSVLGKVRLTGRQAAELLRVGNKLVLVALTTSGAEALTEVTDPAEVDRLVGLCQQHDRHSTTHAFEQVFQNLSREVSGGGFLGAETLPTTLSPIAAAYRSQRGNSRA